MTAKLEDFKSILGPMRPPFLLLTPACVVLGISTAVWTSARSVSVLDSAVTLLGALCAHISVNAFNEYFDFRSGLDARTRRTPFSGGSGALPARPDLAPHTLGVAVATFVLTALVGVYFLHLRGAGLLPLGIAGLMVIFLYTPLAVRNPILCLIAPGLGFGPLMVMGTDFVLSGAYSWTAFLASLVPFFLVNDLLLLNQFPDVEPDRSVGRKHLPITIGRKASARIYGAFLAAAYLSILTGAALGLLPSAGLLGLLGILIAGPAAFGTLRHAEDMKKLLPYMTLNVAANLITPVLLAIGLFSAG
jgi:1,4-dihydroxy-2-naphthoate octaprenyltransferase